MVSSATDPRVSSGDSTAGEGPCNATPSAELERQIMSACEPKNEREWWAQGEIERLRVAVAVANRGLPAVPTDRMMVAGGFSFAGRVANEDVFPEVRKIWDSMLAAWRRDCCIAPAKPVNHLEDTKE